MVVFFVAFCAPVVLAQEGSAVNINTASAEELTVLKHVGEALSLRIVQYREDNGSFKVPEDIMKVPGIGQKVFDMNKEAIVVD